MPPGGVPGTLPELPPSESVFDAVELATADIFLEFYGEWIWYLPRRGAPVKMKAIIDRGPGDVAGGPRRQIPIKIKVKADADEGIDPDTWVATDEVVVHETCSKNKECRRVLRKIIDSDGGFVTFEAS